MTECTAEDSGEADPEQKLLARIRRCPDMKGIDRLYSEICRKINAKDRAYLIQEINIREEILSGIFWRNKNYLD